MRFVAYTAMLLVASMVSLFSQDTISFFYFDNSGITGWKSGAFTGSNSWKNGIPGGGRGYSDVMQLFV